jgi:general secretion pathway protein G
MQAILDTTTRPRSQIRGMSLIEILVVLAIIALISSGIAIYAMKVYEPAKQDVAASEIAELFKAAEMYRLRKGECPKSAHELLSLGLITKVKADPWGSDYVFTCPGEHADLDIASPGKDRELGTDDDVVSWSAERRSTGD